MLTTKPRKTLADYLALPQESGVELIYGELVMSPSPTPRHQEVILNIAKALSATVERRRAGKIFVAPLDVVLSEEDVVQPDIIYVSREHQSIIGDRIQGAPDLVIEVMSPGIVDRDKFVKKALYGRAGVKEYWIVDLAAQTVEVWRLNAGQLAFAALFSGADSIATPLLPELCLPLTLAFSS